MLLKEAAAQVGFGDLETWFEPQLQLPSCVTLSLGSLVYWPRWVSNQTPGSSLVCGRTFHYCTMPLLVPPSAPCMAACPVVLPVEQEPSYCPLGSSLGPNPPWQQLHTVHLPG